MRMAMNRRDDRGFTLVELMVVVLIVAIMLTLGVPGLRDVLAKNRMTSKLNEFVGAIQTARSESIKNNTIARICRSANGTTCSTGSGTGWHQGWIVFIDQNDDGAVSPAVAAVAAVAASAGPPPTPATPATPAVPADEVLLRGGATDGFTFKAGLASATSVRFRPDGTTTCASADACRLRFCLGDDVEGVLQLDATGRPSAQRLDEASGCP